MTYNLRLRHAGIALAHPLSPTAWRNAFVVRPADAIVTTAVKVGIAATIVLIAGGLMGQPQLAGMAALGALTSAFGRYQPYRRLGRMMAIVGVGLLIALTVGAFMGAADVPILLQILVLSILAALAAHVFLSFRISGPGAVILVFAAGAGAGYTQSFASVPWPILAVLIGVVVGWLAGMAPALWEPMAPSRLAVARAIANVVRLGNLVQLGTDDAGPHLVAAMSSLRSARESVRVSAGKLRASSSHSLKTHREAEQLHLLLDEVEAELTLFESASNSSLSDALVRLSRYEAGLRKLRGIPAIANPGSSVVPAASSTRDLEPQGFLQAAKTGLRSGASIHQALRMAGAAALSGWVAVGLDLDHPLWATMGAIAALQGMNYAVTVQRSIQRLVGNVLGAGVALVILSLSLGFWPSVALVIIFQMVAELLVLKNYTLTTIAVTPMALIMTGLGTTLSPDAAFTRIADTLVGVMIGTLVAALSISMADHHHLPARSPKP